MKAIKASRPRPFIKPVIVAAMKHPNNDIATKSKSLIEKLIIINTNIIKIVIKRGIFKFSSENYF